MDAIPDRKGLPGFWRNLRFKLIRRLARHDCIVLNAHLDGRDEICDITIRPWHRGAHLLMCDCVFQPGHCALERERSGEGRWWLRVEDNGLSRSDYERAEGIR